MSMTVWVGGRLPESALPDLLEALRCDELIHVDGDDPDLKSEDQLRAFNLPNPIEFEYDIDLDMSGGTSTVLELDDFCETHKLSIKKLLPPCTSSDNERFNEAIYYRTPGMDHGITVLTDGSGDITMRQSDVLEFFDTLYALSHRPISDMPLLINDPSAIIREYANERLAGKSFPETFKTLLIRHVGHEIPGLPPFEIIKGQ